MPTGSGARKFGLTDDEVRIEEYDPAWPEYFQEIRSRLRDFPTGARIEHVGSTAVPGCAAKPLIDVSVGLAPGSSLDLDVVRSSGLTFRAVNPEAVLFALYRPDGLRIANVHVRYRDSAPELWDLLFRDYLRAHPDDAAEYGEAKRQASKLSGSRADYSKTKAPFVEKLRPRVNAWASETGWATRRSDMDRVNDAKQEDAHSAAGWGQASPTRASSRDQV
jgi:GrpB-like predicted nucleotidyltransferase (UPF0157 family)